MFLIFAKRICPLLSLSQLLEAQQHGEDPFELAVKVDLVAAKLFKFVKVQRISECLFTDQG